jgi:Small Multidrug Resistance protein
MRAGIISQRNTFTTAGSTIAQDPPLARHIPVARTTQGVSDQSFEERRTDAGTDKTVSAWIALFGAGLLEIGWALGLKYSDGLTRFWPTVATVVAIVLSFGLMAQCVRCHSAPRMRCGPESEPPAPSSSEFFFTANRPIRFASFA